MKKNWSTLFASMQKLGQSLMVPVSVLPAAGLMVALGRVLTDFTENKESISYNLGKVFYSSGLSVFEQLSLIFTIGVAIGFTGSAGVAGLAAVTGYFAFTTVLKTCGDILHLTTGINTGVFGGICVGFVVASLYNRFHAVKLPPVLGFFSGKRLVPILSVAACVALALVFVVIWPPIQGGIHAFGESVMDSPYGPAIFASTKRFLIPVGLHHVFYPSFLYEFGSFTTATGQVVHGEATRYFAGDPTAGKFMASEYPMMLFALPAAALAMTLRAKPENRKMVGGVMLSAALTSIITGITEPIEFAYTFVAPGLYVVHSLMAFLGGYLISYFDIHLGYTFSASVIDLGLSYFNQHNLSKFLLIVGPFMAALYFTVFYWAIGYFDFKTPGREDTQALDAEEPETQTAVPSGLREKAAKILVAIGNPENIHTMTACITRLRLVLNDDKKLNLPELKRLGASGVMNAGGGNVQIVFGVESDLIKMQIESIIKEQKASSSFAATAPLSGTVIPASEIPDETFSSEMMGKTIGIIPTGNKVVAPFDGVVATLFHTHHAIGLVSNQGLEMLIHVGIDTVKMDGKGFKAFVKNGDSVKRGQVLLEFDHDLILKNAKSLITPIVMTNAESSHKQGFKVAAKTSINTGDTLWN